MSQRSLLSFFKKESTPAKKDSISTTPGKKITSTPSSQATPTATPSSQQQKKRPIEINLLEEESENNVLVKKPKHEEKKEDVEMKDAGSMMVGKEIEVYWKDDDEWYKGTVEKYRVEDNMSFIKYTDGDTEWRNLDNEKFRLVEVEPAVVRVPLEEISSKDNSDEADVILPKKKLRRIIEDDSSDDEKIVQPKSKTKKRDDDEFVLSGKTKDDDDDDDDNSSLVLDASSDEDEKRKKVIKKKANNKTTKISLTTPSPKPKSYSQSTSKKISSQSSAPRSQNSASRSNTGASQKDEEEEGGGGGGGVQTIGSHDHNSLKWLFAERKDKNKRTPDDPEFNPHTLFVPPEFLKKETPAMQQWWEMKKDFYDTLLFFKVGKFYEIFHIDADVCVKELEINYMKGSKAHCGFPEIAFSKFSIILIDKGYRVARVEQVETPEMMKIRTDKLRAKGEKNILKVVNREICSLVSKGTRVSSAMDPLVYAGDASFLLAIVEIHNNDKAGTMSASDTPSKYGICFVDTLTGVFELGQFTDDIQRSRFRTIIARVKPAEVCYVAGSLSHHTLNIIKHDAPNALTTKLSKEHWLSAESVIEELKNGAYFPDAEGSKKSKNLEKWPKCLKVMSASIPTYSLSLKALGGIFFILQRSLIDIQLFSMKNIHQFVLQEEEDEALKQAGEKGMEVEEEKIETAPRILEDENELTSNASSSLIQRKMILDGVTLLNLQLLENEIDGGIEGTLLQYVDHTQTAFGKRLIRNWVSEPLFLIKDIECRLDAVEDLMGVEDSVIDKARHDLKKLPDLERVLARIHALGSKARADDHPDGRAIFYESATYGKRNIESFASMLDGFKLCRSIIDSFEEVKGDFKSSILKTIFNVGSVKGYPDYNKKLKDFNLLFNQEKAKKEGSITPNKDVDKVYDQCLVDEREAIRALESYLKEVQTSLGGGDKIKFWGNGKDRYQIEVPMEKSKKLGSEFQLQTSTKAVKRFYTRKSLELFGNLKKIEEVKNNALKEFSRGVFFQFDEHYNSWIKAVTYISQLDVLISLALTSKCGDNRGDTCRPIFTELVDQNKAFIEIRGMRHPCVKETYNNSPFIPNDIVLGEINGLSDGPFSTGAKSLLLTGPNMGGKSTLLRQACVAAILSQIGCFVPANKVHLTPVDRVFTRIGASDRILAGQSTFFVELTETAAIMKYATASSLIILDELGRGTSTFDGAAIAYAVMRYLCKETKARTMFSTHYHSLVETFEGDENVVMGHMGCLLRKEEGKEEEVTFLYQLKQGTCDRSYGLNVARLAHLPQEVIQKAKSESAAFEQRLRASMASMEVEEDENDEIEESLVTELLNLDLDSEDSVDSVLKIIDTTRALLL